MTGGKLVDEKRVNANNLSGSSITGGDSQSVSAGDMLIVPANVPHQVIPSGGAYRGDDHACTAAGNQLATTKLTRLDG